MNCDSQSLLLPCDSTRVAESNVVYRPREPQRGWRQVETTPMHQGPAIFRTCITGRDPMEGAASKSPGSSLSVNH